MRAKLLHISASSMVAILRMVARGEPFHIVGIPEDARSDEVALSPYNSYSSVVMTVISDTFEDVPRGEPLPELTVMIRRGDV